MTKLDEASAWINKRLADDIHGIAQAEIARLVAAGWQRTDAVLMVAASPNWPYAAEETIPSGILSRRKELK